MLLGPQDRLPLTDIVRHVSDECGGETSVRRVACRPDDTGTEHAVLRRLLGGPGAEPLPAGRVRRAALTRVGRLLERAPLTLVLTDAQWCDGGTLRCVDDLMSEAAGQPLSVLLSLSPAALSAAGAAFHELVARDYCAVTDVADLWPAGHGIHDLGRYEPHLLPVARAAVMLGSTDVDLVAALAELPVHVAARALDTARDRGLLSERGPSPRLDTLLGQLPAARGERMRAQAAEILNDAAWPAERVAELLLELSTLDRPWMATVLGEAAAAARRERPASAVRCLERLREMDPDDDAVLTALATALLDIDPAASHGYLETVLARTDAPRPRARASAALRLTALMTHRTPDTPKALDGLLGELAARSPERTPSARRPERFTRGPLPGGEATEHLSLSTRALCAALTGTGPEDAASLARQVLRTDRPRPAWTRVAAAQVLGLADDTTGALGHLDRVVRDCERREEVWAECHARSARALLLLESGRAPEASRAALAAARTARGHGWEEHALLGPVALALALVARADVDGAEAVLRGLDTRRFDDSVWAHHHHLMAGALVERARGRTGRALELTERCGASLTSAGVDNPVFTTWWVHSTELLMELGRTRDAAERAELGRHLAERWPTPRSTGLSLLADGTAAGPDDRVELLAESIRTLANSSDRYFLALAELRLGQALLQRADKKAARGHLHTAQALAVRYGLTAVAEPAGIALAAAGGRPALVALSAAERPVAEMATAGATNRAIADALFLTVRTVEYHLTNVYRKLGVTGRADLAALPSAGERGGASRLPGEDR